MDSAADDFSTVDQTPLGRSFTDVENSTSVEARMPLHEAQILNILQHGTLEEQGQLPYSSNYSFLITAQKADAREPNAAVEPAPNEISLLPAVYKPRQGENPLWDFERGTLCLREVAAYIVSAALGWQLVPPTVVARWQVRHRQRSVLHRSRRS